MKNIVWFCFSVCLLASCSPNNVKVDDTLKKYFDENNVQGTFGLFNNSSGDFTIYNLNRYKDSAYLPASTFKIVSALIGLETGKIRDEKMVIKWDGITRQNENWNRDLTMAEAFELSAVPYFQQVTRNIGKDTMQVWLDTLGYGSRYKKSIIGTVDSFWLDNTVKVTTDEQLGLVKKLYFDQLPFQKRSLRIVKDIMVREKNANYTLAYKTGLGYNESGKAIGWIIGWIEENRHPYFFALNTEANATMDVPAADMKILKGILGQLGFLKGKM